MSSTSASLRRRALPYLAAASHLPTPFLSTFLLVHLSAPILANLGGSSLSSQVMVSTCHCVDVLNLTRTRKLLGREYYQGKTSEVLLVFSPLALHVAASLGKRLCTPNPLRISSFNLLSISAFATVILLPTHVLVNRLYPMFPDPPILSLGPGELDYEFVKYGFKNWPWRSTLFYSGLIGGVVLHASEGASLLWDRYISAAPPHARRSQATITSRRVLSALTFLLLCSGASALWNEDSAILPSALARFDAIYNLSFVYRL